MQKFFITATGTGIGKTFITKILCEQFITSGKKVIALKPIISGYDEADMNSDTALILQSCNLPITQENIDAISPWRFTEPLSPNMAADREGKSIDFSELIDFCKSKENTKADVLLIEGVGGVYVPLNNHYTVLDWIKALEGWKIILVTGSYLGSISHTLSTIASLKSKGLALNYLVISESENSTVPLDETIKTLQLFIDKSVTIIKVKRQNSQPINNPMPNLCEQLL